MSVSIPILLSTIVFVPMGTLLPLIVKEYFHGTVWHNKNMQTLFSSGRLIATMVISITGGIRKQFLMISVGIFTLGVYSLIGEMLPSSAFWIFCI